VRLTSGVLLAVLAAVPAGLRAQTSTGFNRVISPEVVAYWQSRDNGDGGGTLELLVLWRGSPGWFSRGMGSSGSGGATGGFGQWNAYHTMSFGDITLTIELSSTSKDFPPATTVAKILGREIPLSEANVVLIDGADSGAPRVVGTRRIEPAFTGADPVTPAIKSTPDLYEFLNCDATVPDARLRPMLAAICAQLKP
jgi:hypothetical protein